MTEPEGETLPTPAAGAGSAAGGWYEILWNTGLLNVLAIARRELGSLFVSPIGWVLGAVVIAPVSLFGYESQVIQGRQAAMDGVFSIVSFLALFLVPLYTMRVLSEERRSGTLELVLTSAVRDWELVAGKWLGVVGFFLATNLYTLVYVVLLMIYLPDRAAVSILGLHPSLPALDYGTILSQYVGLILLACALCGIGVLLSSLTSNQVIAAISGIVAMLLFWYLGNFAGLAQPPFSTFLDYLGGSTRYAGFGQGQIALKDVLYFLSVSLACLFVTTRVIESRRWR